MNYTITWDDRAFEGSKERVAKALRNILQQYSVEDVKLYHGDYEIEPVTLIINPINYVFPELFI